MYLPNMAAHVLADNSYLAVKRLVVLPLTNGCEEVLLAGLIDAYLEQLRRARAAVELCNYGDYLEQLMGRLAA